MNKQLEIILDNYANEMVTKLQDLIKIKSIVDFDSSTKDAPFGPGPKQALDYALALAETKGFETVNFDNRAAEIIYGDADESIGAALHLDIVPEGKSWDFPPYGGIIHDGKIYGRGSTDNKGPFIATLYACLAIKESNLPISKKIRMIVGTCEEIGSFPCIDYYLSKTKAPECGIVPDARFPAIFAEKGFLTFKIIKQLRQNSNSSFVLKSIEGGEAPNVVPSSATAVFIDKNDMTEKTVYGYGKTAHASTPHLGENAILNLFNNLLNDAEISNELRTEVTALSKCFSDIYGSGMDISFEDFSGKLTLNLGTVTYNNGQLEILSNIRFPITFGVDDLRKKIIDKLDELDAQYKEISYMKHFYMDKESDLMKKLIDIYRKETGDTENLPIAHGAGSYARVLDGFVPFGPLFPKDPILFHMENEALKIEKLLKLSKIYAETLYQLAK